MQNDIDVFGCDVGYFQVKWVVRRNGAIETGNYPSVAIRKMRSSTATATATAADMFIDHKTNVEIEIGDVTYEVDTSPDSIAGSRTARAETDNFPREDEYAALVFASLVAIQARKVRLMVLGLPLHTMRHAEFLKQRFEGTHNLRQHGICTVEKVAVIPQPLGALAYLRVAAPLAATPSTTACLVDSGWHTTDLITVENGKKVDHARSVGRPGGAAVVIREVARLVGESIGERIENIDRIDRALRCRHPLHVYGKAVDLQPFLRDALHVTYPIVKALLTVVGTCEDLVVYGTGGAACYYADALKRTLGFDVYTVDRPQLVNAIGFVLAGEAATKPRRIS
ncbi:plasmid segregation protein ParM [Paraburkholderia sp. EB58]|jgi:plasmid segregation protein ParM|uniref:ParM/StbA family protein n=1 Tax=Paraburkholderia sp. EB58 TaxID=3035125 RepID=UPI003D2431F8